MPPRALVRLALVLPLLSCGTASEPAPLGVASSLARVDGSALVAASASSGDEPASPPSSSAARVDAPPKAASPWPDGTKEIVLTWVVHPATEVRGAPYYGRHIDLVARGGDVRRAVPIDAKISIFFAMLMQPRCNHIQYDRKSTVAELYMNGGGNLWYTVDRGDDGALLVTENVSPDGLCTDDRGREEACPIKRRVVGSIPAPALARIVERFAEATREDPDGGPPGRLRELALQCE